MVTFVVIVDVIGVVVSILALVILVVESVVAALLAGGSHREVPFLRRPVALAWRRESSRRPRVPHLMG